MSQAHGRQTDLISRIALIKFFGLLTALGTASLASAQTVTLDLTGDPDSRWYDYFSDSFAQLDGGPEFDGFGERDGFYAIETFEDTGAYVVGPGSGGVTFLNGDDFDDIGTLSFDATGTTGIGVEIAPVTRLLMSWNAYVADNDGQAGGYSEEYRNVTGTVTLTDGEVTSIDLTADVTFFYDFAFFGGEVLPFGGTLTMTGSSFELAVDQSHFIDEIMLSLRYQWSVTGSILAEPVQAAPIPTLPRGAWLLLGGLTLTFVLWRTRRA